MPPYSLRYLFKFHLLTAYYVSNSTQREKACLFLQGAHRLVGGKQHREIKQETISSRCHRKCSGCYTFSHSLMLPRRKQDQKGLHVPHPQSKYQPSKILKENGYQSYKRKADQRSMQFESQQICSWRVKHRNQELRCLQPGCDPE